MAFPSIRGVSCVLVHAPGLVRYGSKPSRELPKQPELLARIQAHLRSYEQAVAYAPNQAFIGNLRPEALWDCPRPWWQNPVELPPRGPYGEIVGEQAFFGLLQQADAFNLVHLEPDYLAAARAELAKLAWWDGVGGAQPTEQPAPDHGRLPLCSGDGREVGTVLPGHAEDSSQTAHILLENLACKASGALALRHLLQQTGLAAGELEYVLGCGEEAVGDRYQRGGGSLSKAMAELCGCTGASGSDVKAFCCAPIHALVVAGALVQAGVYRYVAVVGGGSLAKLGMKLQGHLAKDMPILEDCLGAMAVLVGPADGKNPALRLDLVGRHTVGSGGSARAIYEALVAEPLARAGLRIPDVDRYAVELHNPEITEPAGSGNVPKTNYRTIASLAVLLGQLERQQIDGFERQHGMPGFVPTQGHIPAALPYLAHARDRMLAGDMQRALLIAKGSLFLGKMTNLADGLSVLVERPG